MCNAETSDDGRLIGPWRWSNQSPSISSNALAASSQRVQSRAARSCASDAGTVVSERSETDAPKAGSAGSHMFVCALLLTWFGSLRHSFTLAIKLDESFSRCCC